MRYLHIIPPSRRMLKTYIAFIEKNFVDDNNQHDFISIRGVPKGELELFQDDNRYMLTGKGFKRLNNLRKIIKHYDHVIWYSFIVPYRYAPFVALSPSIQKKSTWVVWGMDLHNWVLDSNTPKAKLQNWFNQKARESFNTVVCLEDADVEKYRAEFGDHAWCVRANLPMSEDSFA